MSMRPGIVFLDVETIGELSKFYQLTRLGNLTVFQTTSPDQRIERIRGKEIVITNKVVIDREVMDASPVLRLICIAATGMNNVDLDYAGQKGILVKNVTGYSTESVVQHTFALLFCLMGNLPYYNNYVKGGDYTRSNLFTHHGKPFMEISSKRFGIIGLGTIGKRVAEVAKHFGTEIVYYSTTGNNLHAEYTRLSLPDLLQTSDIVSIHCPLASETLGLIGYEQFWMMKRNAILINTGRGGIVHEASLARALDEGLIAGAALDVLEKEPPEETNPLLHLKQPDKLIITPHIAWASLESRERLLEGIAQNITDYLEDRK
jgi:glycerate dehydrogenase